MPPYQEDRKKLEKLLDKLFKDDCDTLPEDVVVLGGPEPGRLETCCCYSYESLNDSSAPSPFPFPFPFPPGDKIG